MPEVARGLALALGVKAGERRRSALLFLYLFLASAVFILAILLVLITQVGGEIRRRKLSIAA